MDCKYVGMAESRGRLGLLLKTSQPVRIQRYEGGQDLNRYFALQGWIARAIDLAHSACTQETENADSPPGCFSYSCKLVQIGVWSRVAHDTTHGDDLAFVMKSMRQDMMKDERRSADGDVSIGEMELCFGIELLIG